MKIKKYASAIAAVFLLLLVLEYLIHSVGLMGIYQKTAHLWRKEADIKALGWLMWVSYAVVSGILVSIFARGYEQGKAGVGQGIRFGVWMGILMNVPMSLNCYVVMPIPLSLPIGWILTGMIEFVALGAVIGLIWEK
jgi:hypothetical protein